MNKTTKLLISTVLGLILAITAFTDAFAARLGGGRSFGSRPSYSVPYQRMPSPAGPGMSRPNAPVQQPGMSTAQQRNQTMRDSLAQRGGLTRFLGGMALGGLLGAMFFGGGFEHINFLDILIFGAIAFLLFRMFAARRQGGARVATPGGGYYGADRTGEADSNYARNTHDPQNGPGFDTDILSRKSGGTNNVGQTGATVVVPADFDTSAFLNGAKSAYTMLQKAWDDGDLAELRGLTNDKVFAELQEQIRARGGSENRTDLLKVEAELLEVRDIGAERVATVLFDVLMRETPDARAGQVREVWHFTRPLNSRQPTWYLDGIQQLEE